MLKKRVTYYLLFLLFVTASFSKVVSREIWSRNDWAVFYGNLDSLENFVTFESFKKFKGVESNGWNTFSWYDTVFEDVRWADSAIIDSDNNRVKYFARDFDKAFESGDAYDSVYLEFDNEGYIKEKIRFQEHKDVYSINKQDNKIDTVIRSLWDTTNLTWQKETQTVYKYQNSKLIREEEYFWNNNIGGWDDSHILKRYTFNSSGKIDSSFYTVGGASEIFVYSYSNDNKTITAIKYEQWNPDDDFLLIGQKIIELNDLGKDSVITYYQYSSSGDSMQVEEQEILNYTENGDIKEFINKRNRSGVLTNYWKNEFNYNAQNLPSGFNFLIFYQGEWIIEDFNTVSFKQSTPIADVTTDKLSAFSSARVIQNHNHCFISFQLSTANLSNAKLFDMQGRVIKSIDPTIIGSKIVYKFNTESIAKGRLYLFCINSLNRRYTKSILLK